MTAITNKIKKLMAITFLPIRRLASVIGAVISLFPAFSSGKLYYRALEKDKTFAVKKSIWKF